MLDRAGSDDSITENLHCDHHAIDLLIADLAAMIEDGELERADHSFADVDSALRRHIRFEEEVLFPEFEARTHPMGPTQVMRHEHRQIEAWLDALAEALGLLQRAQASTALAELLLILGQHNLKEERVLYPRMDAILSTTDRRTLLSRFTK
jgi:regulator of cell morphogenesis and NO signaling